MFIKLNYCLQTLTNVYEDFYMKKDMFDFSEHPANSRFYNVKKKKLIDKVKGETKLVPVVELVGLKSKLYSYIKK